MWCPGRGTPPLPLCTSNDFYYNVTECDGAAGTRQLNFSWNTGVSCDGGTALPNGEELVCE